MNHRAVRAIYTNAVTIDDAAGVFDKDGNKIEIDFALVNSWVDPNLYQIQRAAEYPSFADQFDLLYHGGYDAWKGVVQAIKDKYPKPE